MVTGELAGLGLRATRPLIEDCASLVLLASRSGRVRGRGLEANMRSFAAV